MPKRGRETAEPAISDPRFIASLRYFGWLFETSRTAWNARSHRPKRPQKKSHLSATTFCLTNLKCSLESAKKLEGQCEDQASFQKVQSYLEISEFWGSDFPATKKCSN
jgi:hypothetical protein